MPTELVSLPSTCDHLVSLGHRNRWCATNTQPQGKGTRRPERRWTCEGRWIPVVWCLGRRDVHRLRIRLLLGLRRICDMAGGDRADRRRMAGSSWLPRCRG